MKNWFLWMIAGLISLFGGFFALANPLAATLTAELLAGGMFVAVGIMTMVSSFGAQGWGGRDRVRPSASARCANATTTSA